MDSIVGEWTLRYPDEDYFPGELNMVMKMMLKGKLEKGINQLGEGLAKSLIVC